MSNPRWVSSRGASIIAALVFAGILTAAAVAIQSTVPAIHTPAFAQAAFIGNILPASQLAAVDSTGVTGLEGATSRTVRCASGFDYSIAINENAADQTVVGQPQTFQICPREHTSKTRAPLTDRTECKDGMPTTKKAETCQYVATSEPNRWVLDFSWKCRVRIVDPKGSTPAQKCYIQETQEGKDAGGGAGKVQPPTDQAGARAIAESIARGDITRTDLGPLTPQQQALMDGAFSAEADGITAERDAAAAAVKAAEAETEAKLQALTACGQNTEADCNQQITDLQAAQREQEAAQQKLSLTNDQLNRLNTAQTALAANPTENTNKPPPTPTDTPPGAKPPPNNNQAPPGGPGQASTPTARPASQQPTNPFQNPSLGANNQPQSPFGGPCVQKYVCQGNMLYYQTPQSYGGTSGQCMTQPVQQCQYGCMLPYGQQQGQQNGMSNTGSMLQGIGAGLQIFSSLSNLFGGGTNNGSSQYGMTPQNQSSQCAMTPQQGGQPSPYGNGNNGQPCQQPPQQPSPSQCTTGQWKPTSGSGNGCTTGWQCVPTGGTPTNPNPVTPPTAQLSCQPRLADVGMQIGFSFSCGNATASSGGGFSTGGAVSGVSSSTVTTPPVGQNIATYTLTCINQGQTASAQCQVEIAKPSIIMVTNPQQVPRGEIATLGWITTGMDSCVISSPDQNDFTQRNASYTSVNGTATTSPITATTQFALSCETLGGQIKSATTTVSIN